MDIEQQRIAIQKAVKIAGSQYKLAQMLRVQPQHVWNWLNKNQISIEKAIEIERLFDIRVEETRPDIDWSVVRAKPGHAVGCQPCEMVGMLGQILDHISNTKANPVRRMRNVSRTD